MKKIFAKYKWLLIALLTISMIAVPIAGDALSYVSGFQALFGTVILGIITVEQGQDAQKVNERLSEENNKLQKSRRLR